MNETLGNITGKQIPDPSAMAENMANVPIDPERMVLPEKNAIPVVNHLDAPVQSAPIIKPVSTPSDAPVFGQGSGILTPDEAAAMGIASSGTQVNVQAAQFEESDRKFKENQQKKQAEMAQLFEGAIADEEDRLKRLDNALQDDATREELLGPAQDRPSGNVSYDQISLAERNKINRQSTDPVIDPYDLMPAYSNEEENTETPNADGEDNKDKVPNPADSEYGQFIREMEHVTLPDTDISAVRTLRDPVVEISDSDNKLLFSNWLNRNEPGDMPLQHVDYDVWLVRCE